MSRKGHAVPALALQWQVSWMGSCLYRSAAFQRVLDKNIASPFSLWRISLVAERACLKVDSSESGWDLLGSLKGRVSLPCLFFSTVLTLLLPVSAQQRLAPYHSSSKSLLCPLYPVYSFVSISQLLLCSSCASRRSVDPFYFPC